MKFTTMYSTLERIILAVIALRLLPIVEALDNAVCLPGWDWVRSSPSLVCRGLEPNPSVFPVVQFRGPESVSDRGSASRPVSRVLFVVNLPLSQRNRLLIGTHKQLLGCSNRSTTLPTTPLLGRMTLWERSADATRLSTACTRLALFASGHRIRRLLRKLLATPKSSVN
jgi:hypothetical protein